MLHPPQAITLQLSSADETQQLGEILGRSLPSGSILLLEGNLGSGKTTLVQGIGQGLGITDAIVSPTFTLINEYLEGRVPLYHLDLYRLQPEEVGELYLEAYWEGTEVVPGIVAIEWPERLPEVPPSYLHVQITSTPEDTRSIAIAPVGCEAPQWSLVFRQLQELLPQ